MGFEPMIRVLQTLALPLGHVATIFCAGGFYTRTTDWSRKFATEELIASLWIGVD